jgi:hypothetical protein
MSAKLTPATHVLVNGRRMTRHQRAARALVGVVVAAGLAASAVACAKKGTADQNGVQVQVQGQGQFGHGTGSSGAGNGDAVVTTAPAKQTTKPPTKPPTSPSATAPPPVISPVDCIPYDPNTLKTVDGGLDGWFLYEGDSHSMMLLDTLADANQALGVARLYTKFCFIGRGNSRTNRKQYITVYFTTSSGLAGALPTPDCLPYDQPTLKVTNLGALGWRLEDKSQAIQLADNSTDAANLLTLARQNSAICFIGRDNSRPNRFDYIYTYWKS